MLLDSAQDIYTKFNSSPPTAAYMLQWMGPALVQIMVCRLFGAKPLSKPKLGYCQLNPKEATTVKFQNTKLFIHENALSAKWQPYCPGRWDKDYKYIARHIPQTLASWPISARPYISNEHMISYFVSLVGPLSQTTPRNYLNIIFYISQTVMEWWTEGVCASWYPLIHPFI